MAVFLSSADFALVRAPSGFVRVAPPPAKKRRAGLGLGLRRGVRKGAFMARLSTDSCEVRVSDSAIARHFSAPARSKSEEKKSEYYVNTGHAIRTLREELPEIFNSEPNFDIYRDDITFKDPLNTFVGLKNYKMIFWALRINGRIFFKALSFDVISVWQPVDNIVMLRWTVHGIPRIPWDCHGRFDGTSEYKFDKNGKIYEHRVDNVVHNSPPKFHVLSVQDLIVSLGCPSTPKPTYFEMSSPRLMNSPFTECDTLAFNKVPRENFALIS